MPDVFRHPPFGSLSGMGGREPCAYILASTFNFAVALGLEPLR